MAGVIQPFNHAVSLRISPSALRSTYSHQHFRMKHFLFLLILGTTLTACHKEPCEAVLEYGHTYTFGVADYTFYQDGRVVITDAYGDELARRYTYDGNVITVNQNNMRFGWQADICAFANAYGNVMQY